MKFVGGLGCEKGFFYKEIVKNFMVKKNHFGFNSRRGDFWFEGQKCLSL